MKQLKIKDNDQRKKEEFFDIPGLVKTIADKTLEELEKEGVFVFPEMVHDAEDVTRDQMILQSVNDSYRSGNVMGFLGYGEERLVIESRFSTGDNDYLFQYLLERVLDFLILSIIVGTYITKILVPMLLYPKLHNIAYV